MNERKNILKLSNLLLNAVYHLRQQRLQQIRSQLEEFRSQCSKMIKYSDLFNTAIEKNWFNSAHRIKTKANRYMIDFRHYLDNFKNVVNIDESRLPNLSGIYAELSQTKQEHGEYQYNLEKRTISVITEPITLDDIDLGPFEIRLFIDRISRLYTESPYRIIALEPNPAGADNTVTHPHVRSEQLCEGDGYIPIRKALEQGRLCDFFTVIISILQNYNPDSPFILLDEWDGYSCYDCGYTVSYDESYYCEKCEQTYCHQCSTYCQKCDTAICLGCAFQCPSCEEPVCNSCSAKCKECEEIFCESCLTDEGLCPDCEEQRKEYENEEQEDESKKSKTAAAVQPDSVGQAIVHA